MCSETGHGDFAGKVSCGLGGLGAKMLEVKGLKGPRGNGSARGRGGNLRSSPRSTGPDELFEIERMLLRVERYCQSDNILKRWQTLITYGKARRWEISSQVDAMSSNIMVPSVLGVLQAAESGTVMSVCLTV
jgi:hypothetical protein